MDQLLKKARSLYISRQRIAAVLLISMSAIILVPFYSYVSNTNRNDPPVGWTSAPAAEAMMTPFNTIGFVLALSVMVLFYIFWRWAFIPSPAASYTIGVLQGVFGQRTHITQLRGKRFRVYLNDTEFIEVKCRIKDRVSGDWFLYLLKSPLIVSEKISDIALKHGFRVKGNRLTALVTADELHLRSILLAKAISIASSQMSAT